MFTVNFPVDTGTFVIVNHKDIDLTNPQNLLGRLGSISCYHVTEQDTRDGAFLVTVSGYKDYWCGQYFLNDLMIATDEQVKMYEKEMGIN